MWNKSHWPCTAAIHSLVRAAAYNSIGEGDVHGVTNQTGQVRLLSIRLYALRPTNRLETVERITLVIYGCYLTTSWHMHTVTDNLIREGDIPARTNQTDGPGWAAHHSHVRTAAYNSIGEERGSRVEQI